MNNDYLVKKIEKLIEPVNAGLKRLEQGQMKLAENFVRQEERQTKLEMRFVKLEERQTKLEESVEMLRTEVKNNHKESMEFITDILHTASTQKQVDDHEERIVLLEEKTGTRN